MIIHVPSPTNDIGFFRGVGVGVGGRGFILATMPSHIGGYKNVFIEQYKKVFKDLRTSLILALCVSRFLFFLWIISFLS